MDKPKESEKITETVPYSHYEININPSSRIGIREKWSRSNGFNCPRCWARNEKLNHGDSSICEECGMEFQLWGNALNCTAEEIMKTQHVGFEVDKWKNPTIDDFEVCDLTWWQKFLNWFRGKNQ